MLPNPYGAPVSLDDAKKAAAPALAEARKNNWLMAVAIVDPAGHLVYFEKMDGTQTGSVTVAIAKARSAALFKRSTKTFQDTLAGGGEGLRVLNLDVGGLAADVGRGVAIFDPEGVTRCVNSRAATWRCPASAAFAAKCRVPIPTSRRSRNWL
jgi:uncharacterized protein GlcG (DUF336 family)